MSNSPTIKVAAFRLEHYELMQPDPMFTDGKDGINIKPLIRHGDGSTFFNADTGEVLACVGYVRKPGKPNVYWVWMIPAIGARRYMLRIARFIDKWTLTLCPGSRVECSVVAGFGPGLRLMRAIGFEQETPEHEPARLYDGERDHHLFARVLPADARGRNCHELLKDFAVLGAGRSVHDLQLRGGHGRICPL